MTPCSPLIGSDGVYTGYCGLASSPGTYSLRITVTDNKGAAVAPRRRGDTHTHFYHLSSFKVSVKV